jgi:hypothetical protein
MNPRFGQSTENKRWQAHRIEAKPHSGNGTSQDLAAINNGNLSAESVSKLNESVDERCFVDVEPLRGAQT